MNISRYFKQKIFQIEKEMARLLPDPAQPPKRLNEAVRYAVFSGGKRVRPILVLAACEAVGGAEKKAMPAALAVELIHNYSLTHDDLPCMDNDKWRRGKPTCHKKFGETTALLAGDALLTLAFRVLSETRDTAHTELVKRMEALRWIAEAAGLRGMVAGQAVDMEFQKKDPDLPTMQFINAHKTGALIAVSTRAGALLGGGTPAQIEALYGYGKHLGLLFQIVDDILDGEGYAKLFGASGARQEALSVHARAVGELKKLGPQSRKLSSLADFVLERKH